jgi:hypothetical protein
MRRAFGLLLIAATISLSPAASRAEEGLAGHYFPGALSSSFDLAPLRLEDSPGYTLAASNISTYYHGSSNTFGTNATSYTNTSVFLYQFPGRISNFLPGKPQYSVALAVPYTWLKVHTPAGKDTDNGFGDVEMFPILLNWNEYRFLRPEIKDQNFPYLSRYQMGFGIFAPTGAFESGPKANIGKNYWTFEPSAAVSYVLTPSVGSPYSLEFTNSAGFDFNTENGKTHYQTGDQFHWDGTLAAYLVLFGGAENEATATAGVGVSGYYYQQFTGDSVNGTSIGFKGKTIGVGPNLSYLYKNAPGNMVMGAQVKWLPELSVSNRLQGNIVWLKLVFAWGAPAQKTLEAAALQAAPTPPTARALYAIPSL